MRPEKLEDCVRLHDIRQKMFDMTSEKSATSVVAKKRKKLTCWLQNYVNLLNTKAMDHQNLIETDVAIDRQCLAIKTQFRNWSH